MSDETAIRLNLSAEITKYLHQFSDAVQVKVDNKWYALYIDEFGNQYYKVSNVPIKTKYELPGLDKDINMFTNAPMAVLTKMHETLKEKSDRLMDGKSRSSDPFIEL
jgi:hypothetical protein